MEYRDLAARHGVEASVELFGPRPDVNSFLERADVFVLPTLYETFCLAAYEAARAGVPIVATPVSGVLELVGDEEGGLVVARTPESVANAIGRLLEDPALGRRLADEAGRRAAAFTWNRSAATVVDAYRRLGAVVAASSSSRST